LTTETTQPIHLAIHGAAGRMGRRLIALTPEFDALRLVAAIERPGHELIDASIAAAIDPDADAAVVISDHVPEGVDVLIDFTAPAAMRRALDGCARAGAAMVIGTTGLSDDDHQTIDDAAALIPVLQAPNMSLGVNLLFALAGRVAKQLGDDYDIEIVEAHHRFKKDAPSGTALGLARSICDATGKDMQTDVVHGRVGDEVPRQRGRIGMHALRMGDVVGEHTVSFGTLG